MAEEYKTGSATLTLLDDRLRITKHGLGGLWQGGAWKGAREIPYDSIVSVEWRSAGRIKEGYIQFVTAASVGKEPYHDESAIVFSRRSESEMARAKEVVDQRRRESRRPSVSPSTPADQIRQLAELRDAGIVTAEEFEAKKAELLARM